MARIFILDDDETIVETLRRLMVREGHDCATAGSLSDGLASMPAFAPDVVFLDLNLPDGNGLSILDRIKSLPGRPEVIVLTGKGDTRGAETAMEGGVWDYLVKPSPVNRTLSSLQRAMAYRTERGCREDEVKPLRLTGLIGTSPAMKACLAIVGRAACGDAPVLLQGETGSGKERFAKAIHDNSRRAKGPFVAVDCASLTESLAESILFGHVRGAFTSAARDRMGLVAAADTGTLFLDEIGELPLSMQKIFLRVLQEKTFRPVGDTKEQSSDFRLVAATNRDLVAMVEDGGFRQDLYFRVKSMVISLPPLREREEDLKPLALVRMRELAKRYGEKPKAFDPGVFDVFSAYSWPGNVRELFAVLESAYSAAGDSQLIYPRHLPSDVRARAAMADALPRHEAEHAPATQEEAENQALAQKLFASPGAEADQLLDMPLKGYKNAMERRYINRLIERFGADIESMAAQAELSKSHLYALLKKHGLKSPS